MRTLVIVRHGETVGNSSIRYFGRTDLELSGLGRQQIHAARRWLRNHFGATRFAPIIASPLRRAVEGAIIIGGPECPIIQIEEFVEVDFGRFEGLTAEEIATRYPADFERWNRDRLDPSFSYPGGESRRDFTDRVTHGIDRLLSMLSQTSQPASHPQSTTQPQPVLHPESTSQPQLASHPQSTSHSERSASAIAIQPTMADVSIAATDDLRLYGDVALVVAHRGVNRIVCKRLAGVEPQIELGSIQILERASPVDEWHAASIDIVEHLAGLT
jgi:broad specificity phosphatase PhoE